MALDFSSIRLQEDRTIGLSVEETCIAALGPGTGPGAAALGEADVAICSTYTATPQMSTTYRDVLLSLLLKSWQGIRYLHSLFQTHGGDEHLIGFLSHTHDDSFMVLSVHRQGLLKLALEETIERGSYSECMARLTELLDKSSTVPMVKINIMAPAADNISVLFLGALVGLGGFYCDKETFCATSVVQYYNDSAIPSAALLTSGSNGIVEAAKKELKLSQSIAITQPARILALKGPFIGPQTPINVAVDTIHKLVERFQASVLLLTGPLLVEYPEGKISYASEGSLTLPRRCLSIFLHSLHVSMIENRCHAIVSTDCNCLLAPDPFYPTLPYSLSEGVQPYKTISLAGDPVCFTVAGVKFAYMSSALSGFQFIESTYLREARGGGSSPSPPPPPAMNGKLDAFDKSPSIPASSVSRSPVQPSPFRRLEGLPSPLPSSPSTAVNSAPRAEDSAPARTSDEPFKKAIPPNENLPGLCNNLIVGRTLSHPDSATVLTGMEQKRLLYYVNAVLELQTAVPEFPSSRTLLYTRSRDTWIDPDTDVLITSIPSFSPPLMLTSYNKARIVVSFVENVGKQALVITLQPGTDAMNNLVHCEAYNVTTSI